MMPWYAWIVLVSLLWLPSMAAAETAPAKVKVGVFSSISDAGIYVALEKGFFREAQIDVEMSEVQSAAAVTTALASGELDVAGGSPGAGLYNAVRQGIPIRAVADKGSSLPGHGYLAFVVRKELADKGLVKRPADLRGKLLAATGYGAGASNELTVDRLLKEGGLTDSDVRVVHMAFADILAGLGTGKVDVGILIEPLVTQAVDRNVGVLWRRVDEVYPSQQYAALMYGPGMTFRPDVGKRFMVAYLKSVRFYNDALRKSGDRDALMAVLMKHTKVRTAELYRKMAYPGLNPNGFLNVEGMAHDMRWWVSAGRIKEAVDVSKVVDHSYVEFALRELGRYPR